MPGPKTTLKGPHCAHLSMGNFSVVLIGSVCVWQSLADIGCLLLLQSSIRNIWQHVCSAGSNRNPRTGPSLLLYCSQRMRLCSINSPSRQLLSPLLQVEIAITGLRELKFFAPLWPVRILKNASTKNHRWAQLGTTCPDNPCTKLKKSNLASKRRFKLFAFLQIWLSDSVETPML